MMMSKVVWADYLAFRARLPMWVRRLEWLQSCEYHKRREFWIRHIDTLVPLPSLIRPRE